MLAIQNVMTHTLIPDTYGTVIGSIMVQVQLGQKLVHGGSSLWFYLCGKVFTQGSQSGYSPAQAKCEAPF
jgi:hypothetical protein